MHEYSYADEKLAAGKYVYRLKQIDNDGTYEYSSEVEVTTTAPAASSLNQNYPNPFNPTTKIAFNIHEESQVTLKIYDIIGKEVATLITKETMTAGSYTKQWDASALPSGVYFYQLITDNLSQVKKMLMLK
jgi:hypothetical protein